MMGYDFHRQKPINNYILDFFCHELMLGIELDGITHQEEITALKDRQKEEKLNLLGVHILRFEDDEVMNDIDNVLSTIENYILDFEGKQIEQYHKWKQGKHTPLSPLKSGIQKTPLSRGAGGVLKKAERKRKDKRPKNPMGQGCRT
eukprot:TRINITY_DN39637_c0_g1_i1.p2 TRINITY_DN39637_c0_g1~~TRINITY_DN39637_c0_g1_i1.p2  ORF type:complete len:146 (-),score=16.16 TRINITY_DN39637_c0_g1_i1:2-439(-)